MIPPTSPQQLDASTPTEQRDNKQGRRASRNAQKAKKQKHKKDKKANRGDAEGDTPERDVPEQVLHHSIQTSDSSISDLSLSQPPENNQRITFLPAWDHGQPTSFSIPKSDIYLHIPILKSTINSSLFQDQPWTYRLKHCGPGTLSLFQSWILTQELDLGPFLEDRVKRVKLRYDLAFLFILAEELHIDALKKESLGAILSLRDGEDGDGFIPWCALGVIWSITGKESVLRKVYIDGLVWGNGMGKGKGKGMGRWEDQKECFTKEMLLEVCSEYRRVLVGDGEREGREVEDYLNDEEMGGKGKGKVL